MIALGTGASETVSDDLQSAGTTLINVRAGNYTRGGSESNIPSGLGSATTLTSEDGEAIGKISDDTAANRAIEACNGRDLLGRALVVNEARPMVPREGGGGGRPGGGGGRERRGGRPGR